MAELIFVNRTKHSYGIFNAITRTALSELPDFIKDGTIALITSEPVNKIIIQANAPEEEGVAWIPSGDPTTVVQMNFGTNALIDFMGAFVKINNIWVAVETYIRQNQEWVFLWSSQLLDGTTENFFPIQTGYWTSIAKKAASNSTAAAEALEVATESPFIRVGHSTSAGSGMFYTNKKIDLTPYKTIVFEGEFTRGGSATRNFTLGAWTDIGTYYTSNLAAYVYMSGTSGSRLELDVTDINQECYLGLGLVYSIANISKAYLILKEA
jgi:hypothetical protein